MLSKASGSLFFVLCVFSINTYSKSVVIYDSGVTRSVKPYLDAIGIKTPNFQMLGSRIKYDTKKLNAAANLKRLVNSSFPVESDITPGFVPSRSVENHHLAESFCIVGDEPTSHRWLYRNYDALVSVSATCFIADVRSKNRVDLFNQNFSKLQFVAANVDELSAQYGVHHYPVLITRSFVEQ